MPIVRTGVAAAAVPNQRKGLLCEIFCQQNIVYLLDFGEVVVANVEETKIKHVLSASLQGK